ncbi:MAG: hypothetical protein IIZ33_03570 [Erysipelotrichaceae bacterium]|nr:hypothetical protein [Erysipelotrichaceae bacterium]
MKKNLMKIFTIAASLMVGVLGALSLLPMIPDTLDLASFLLFYLMILVVFVIAYVLVIILHEGGHLIFGLMTGYRFLSFRIFSLLLKRENGKFVWKRYSLAGTGGQCLMSPPNYREPYPCLLYNLGGVIVNVLTALICFLLSLMTGGVLQGIFRVIAIISLYMALTNGIPSSDTVANDGYNALECYRSEESRKSFYQQMKIAALSGEGKRQREMPKELFEGHGQDNDLDRYLRIAKAGRLLDRHEFEKAETEQRDILKKKDCPLLFESYAKNDLLYLDIKLKREGEEIEELHKDLKKLKTVKDNPFYIRSEYAYAVYKEDDRGKQRALEAFRKAEKNYPYPQDIESERELIEAL